MGSTEGVLASGDGGTDIAHDAEMDRGYETGSEVGFPQVPAPRRQRQLHIGTGAESDAGPVVMGAHDHDVRWECPQQPRKLKLTVVRRIAPGAEAVAHDVADAVGSAILA